jgi:hypothetical protein
VDDVSGEERPRLGRLAAAVMRDGLFSCSTVMAQPTLQQLVEEWIRLDQNSTTRKQIESLWKEGQTEDLERRMRSADHLVKPFCGSNIIL